MAALHTFFFHGFRRAVSEFDHREAIGEFQRSFKRIREPCLDVFAHDEAVHSRHRYTRGELGALLRSQGFELVRATYCNFFLFPLLIARRTLDRATGRHGSDVQFLPAPVERAFRGLLELEARLVRSVSLPFGTSALVLGRKLPSPA